MTDDHRIIEDFLPIQPISAEASREKSVRKGHISTLHLWWARRPLVACRAAVYGALVPASRFIPENGPDNKKQSLGRTNAARFIERLCKYPGNPTVIREAQKHILEAHAERLSEETGKKVTVEDIEEGRAPRPKVLDMFAGGGAIPLEALRLGCEAYALDLNPVAHIIELCTLVYPQKYGKPDPNARGMTGPKNAYGETTWGGLADEVRYWGEWVLKKVKTEIGDLYPLIPDPDFHEKPIRSTGFPACAPQQELFVTRRNLPHWQLQGSTYFVTFRIKEGTLAEPERQTVLEAIKHFHGERYWVLAAVVMPDHAHVILRPNQTRSGTDIRLGKLLQSIKGFSAREINKMRRKRGALWQEESFDRIIRDEEELLEKWKYIRQNPIKQGLCEKPEEYPFLWESFESLEFGNAQPGKAVLPEKTPAGYLTPIAYLWTRTVRCKNPACGATVPLVRQTWMCKKKDRYVALKMIAPKGEKRVRFNVVESRTEKGLGFDPTAFSKGGNATCPFCGTVADSDYVKTEGQASRMGTQMMAIVCTRQGRQGKIYLSADNYQAFLPDDETIKRRIEALCQRKDLTMPNEPIITDAKNSCWTHLYGLTTFGDLFTPRQMLCLITFAAAVREAYQTMITQASLVAQAFQPGHAQPGHTHPAHAQSGHAHLEYVKSGHAQPGKAVLPYDLERAKAVGTYLGVIVNRLADYNSALCHWHTTREILGNTFGRQALPMVWDFVELAPFGDASGSPQGALDWIVSVAEVQTDTGLPATVLRGSATALPSPALNFDAVITDPPYYDNVPYADISDFFYVWLKRTIGHLYPEHFATEGTPKKQEAVADAMRHGGSKEKARHAYERMMAQSFA
ncbi:MAG: DUF1156 domain-containing protein, partial [Bacteroidota bacterium]|nr:DUF1156 domain-containing protein [Bacteroidota bacterium]